MTFEGLDGSGKSTQLEVAGRYLESIGRRFVVTHEPGGTELGERLRAAFLDPKRDRMDGVVEALVVFASRRQHLVEVIEPALAAGQDVLCDRFTDSTVAYQGFGRGIPIQMISDLDELATGSRRPDLTVLLDLPAEVARQRAAGEKRLEAGTVDRLDREKVEFYDKVRSGYLEIAQREPERVRIVDSSGAIAHTTRATERVLREFFEGGGE